MKLRSLISLAFLLVGINCFSQSFKFAFVSDTHIGNETADEDLERTVADINLQNDLEFVVITGDITEMGTDKELALAKSIFSKLNKPYYIMPGNHDTGWSESGGVSFIREFGYDKFVFDHKGYRFIGCASGPYVRMSDGHIPRDAVVWMDSVLTATPKDQPIVFLNHYPLENALDNWFEVIDRLKNHNTQLALCGHGHGNREVNAEGIPAVMGRSNLRAKALVGGYNIVEFANGVASFAEKTPGKEGQRLWKSVKLQKQDYKKTGYPRPSFAINDQYKSVRAKWTFHSDANVISTPVFASNLVIYGNSIGAIEALSIKNGKKQWTYKTGGAIYSSPAVSGNKMIIGSGDGNIYCLDTRKGKLLWKLNADAAVLGTPIIENDIAYIGGSDHKMRAININSGKELWAFGGLEGAVVSQPLIYEGKIIFGAWDRHLYALDKKSGELIWKWNNGHTNRMFSPAMVNPVATKGVIYIAAPDRYLSAIDAISGKTLWRTNEATVRESIGISANKELIYGKTMNDEIVAFKTGGERAELAWKMNAAYGYEHVPSMLIEKSGVVYFGTKNGTVYAIDPLQKKINWAHKIDNSMINTVNVLAPGKVIAATMDGKIALLEAVNK
ncbi:MAG TPA: PQQ-binding-like beta-propeller repeat protein [Sphingobacteriaceae bacterium]|nr:PQQ-binding-like beta-propeller repeat protein [Sphingobacteriaceae bacterium]